MPKKKRSKRSPVAGAESVFGEVLSLYAKLADLKKDMAKVTEGGEQVDDRLANIEFHVNILARLLTTLCIEKFGIRLGALKQLVRRIEKEALRDSQITELESLYKLSHRSPQKASSPEARSKDDPWEQIS